MHNPDVIVKQNAYILYRVIQNYLSDFKFLNTYLGFELYIKYKRMIH